MSPKGQQQSESTLVPFTVRDLLLYFLHLGTFGFGGPIALAGYMQRDLVEGRRWVSKQDYLEGLAFSHDFGSISELPTVRPLSGSSNDTTSQIPFPVSLRSKGGRPATRPLLVCRQRLSPARSLCSSGFLRTLIQLGLRQVDVPHRLRDGHRATRNFVIM